MVFFSCLGVLILAVMGLAGWLAGSPALGSLFPGAISMAPATAAVFGLLAWAVLLGRADGRRTTVFSLVLAALCLAFVTLNALGRMTGLDLSLENTLVSRMEGLAGHGASRISPATDVFFILSCLGLIFFLLGRNGRAILRHATGMAGGLVGIGGLTIFLGYLFGQPLLSGNGQIPVAATTSLGFACLGASIAALPGSGYLPLYLFSGDSVRARLMRVLVPVIVLTLLSSTIIDICLEHYLAVNDALVFAVQVMVCSAIASVFIFRIGHSLDESLNAAENERKAMDGELRDKLRFIQSLMDAAATPIYFKDVTGRYQGCNKAAEDMLGIAREDLVGKTAYDVFPPAEAALVSAKDDELFGKGGTQSFETTMAMPDGRTRDVIFQKAPYFDSENRTQGLIGIVTDITDRKRAERELRENEEVLRKILTGIRAGIFIIDPMNFTIVDVNPIAAEIVGRPAEDILGKPWREIGWRGKAGQAGPNHLPEASDKFDRDLFIERPDGKVVPILKAVISTKRGGRLLLFEVVFDITERKALERQLAIAQKLESLGELAAGIAHEINTPIQYIGDNLNFLDNSFADILDLAKLWDDHARLAGQESAPSLKDLEAKKEEIDLDYCVDEIPKAIAQSKDGVQRVAKIVQAMKRFSHPGVEEKVGTDINSAIETTVLIARNEWKYVAEVDLDLDRTLPMVFCLPGDINQVLLNILINAVHAIADKMKGTGERGRIAIKTTGDGEFFKISMSDTGCGIPQANLDKIFDPFFTTKEVGKGTGQGLAIAHNIVVEKHGGTIEVESEPGQGSTFHIRLPYAGPN